MWAPWVPPRVTSWKSPSGERKYARIPILSPRFETGSSNVAAGRQSVERNAVGNPGSDRLRELGERLRGEVAAPAAGFAASDDDGIARNVNGGRGGHVAGEADQRGRRAARPAVEDGHELREVLVDDVGSGCRVGGLVSLAGHERRAIRRREDREAEACDEERRGDSGAAGIAGERQRGKAERDRSAAAEPAEPTERREQEPRRGDGGGEGDERRHEQDECPRSAPGERARVHRAARVAHRDHDAPLRSRPRRAG